MNIWDYNFHYNAQAVFFSIFLFILAIYKYGIVYRGVISNNKDYLFVFLLLALFSTFAYGEADFYHYQFHYDMMKHYDVKSISEPIYFWIAKNLPDNYFIWRFSIWGTAALFMVLSLKIVGVNASCAGLMLPIYFWAQFSLTRGGLGFAIITLSFAMFFSESKLAKIFALVAVSSSIFFHHSIAAFLLIVPLALITPLHSKLIRFSLLLFPVLYLGMMVGTNYLLDLNFLNSETEQLAEHYFEGAKASVNVFGAIFDILHFSGQLTMLYLAMNFVLNNKANINKVVVALFKYGYILVYISFLFYGQGTSSFLSSRFLHASTFPLVIVYSYYLTYHRMNKTDRLALLLLGSYALYALLYAMYKWW